jgi:hypothetical protein
MSSKDMGDIGKIVDVAAPSVQAYGAVAAGAGAYAKSQADQAAYTTQAAVADNNSQLSRLQASDAITRGQTAQVTSQLKTRQLMGRQAAAMSANGVSLAEGSPLNILSDTEFMGANDATIIANNAAKEAWGYNLQAENSANNAEMLRHRAAAENPGRAFQSSLLNSFGTVASRWYGARHNLAGVQ